MSTFAFLFIHGLITLWSSVLRLLYGITMVPYDGGIIIIGFC